MAAVVANDDTRRGRGPRVGVALSPTALCAAIQRPGESRAHAWRSSIVPFGGNGGAWTGLTDALRALARGRRSIRRPAVDCADAAARGSA